MSSYHLSLLGLEVSFKTDAGQERVNQARKLLEERFKGLDERGRILSKEKILILLALSLADDLLQTIESRERLEGKIGELLNKVDSVDSP